MSRRPLRGELLVTLVVVATDPGCRQAQTETSDAAAVVDMAGAERPVDAATDVDIVGAERPADDANDGHVSYVRVACSQGDPPPGGLLDNVECGRLTLPPRAGSGPAILPVLRVSPRTANKKEDPVIVLAGGPGQSAVSLLREFYLEFPFATFLGQRDVIAIGFRGTDGAEPDLACTEQRPVEFSNREVASGAADGMYSACRDRLTLKAGALAQFGSRQNADDVIALVGALGVQSWNAYGVSYGTRTALELVRLNPAGLRAILLESPVPADVPLVKESVLRGNEILVRVLGDCKNTPSCNAAFPDVSGKLERMLDRFAAAPERRRLPDGVITVDDSQILFILQALLSVRAGAEQVPLMIEQMDSDISQIDELLQALVAADRTVSEGVYLSVTCREILDAELDAGSLMDPFLRRLANASHASAASRRLCGVWGVQYEATPAQESSEVPVLLLNGELDPAVRAEWADHLAAGLPRAQTFTIPGEAHAPGDSVCGSLVLGTFLESPQAKVVQACTTEPRPLRFATP
jgi:pimeloyl-ACP methyl ester carboxylesterase